MNPKPTYEELETQLEALERKIKQRENDLNSRRLPHLSSLLNAFEGYIYLCSADYRIEYMNDRLIKRTGYDATGELCYKALHDLESKCQWCVNDRVFSGETVRWEVRSPKDERWYYIINTPVYNDDGSVSKQSLIVDINDQKAAEEEFRRTSEQLSVLFETLPVVPMTHDVEGNQKITFIGNSVKAVTGYKPAEFLQQPDFWVEKIHKEDRATVLSSLDDILRIGMQNLEYRFQLPDGTYKWLSVTRRLVLDDEGRNSHIVGVWQDITHEKKIKIESEARLQQIIQADKLASLGEVVAGVAHEINNPNSFIGYNLPLMKETWEVFAPILKDFGAAHPQWRHDGLSVDELCTDMGEIVEAIKAGSDRINKVVTNLKDFARLDASEQTTKVQVNEVVSKAYDIVGAQARKYIGSVDIRLEENLSPIEGHFQKLEQVVANLIVNAAYAVQKKERGRLVIATRYVERLKSVIIEIEDNGKGMNREVKDKIFEPFFTTRRDSGGTGLGLSVSYGLVQEHHGKIAVLSRPRVGTRFTILLPKDRQTKLINLQPTVLCIDDDPEMLNVMKSYFVKVKEMPLETTDSPEGIVEFLEEHPEVDVVLSDIRMPGISGWQLLELVKNRFPLLPVFLMTGYDNSIEDRAHKYEPDYFFHKPFEFDELNAAIKTIGRIRI